MKKNLVIVDMEVLGEYAFSGCTNLEELYYDGLLEFRDRVVNTGAFANCTKLLTIGTVGKTIYLNRFETIKSMAFMNCSSIQNVLLDNALSIEDLAFYNCTKLYSIVLGSSLTNIDNMAFYGCSNLAVILYNGTSTQFRSIEKGEDWKFDVPTSCIVRCTDGSFPITDFN